MPWHLRFAPGAILRPIGRIVSKAVSLASAIIQPVRQRLNQWNWRKKTALVTALAITAAGTFAYQYKANAAWPAILGGDFLVQTFASYGIGQALDAAFNTKVQKTANANPDGEPLYSNREFYERRYSFDDSGTKTEDSRIDAKADALFHKAYNTTGTDSRLDPSTLDQREVLDHVSDNANLNGTTETYQILENGEPLYTGSRVNPRGYLKTIRFSWGGYIQKPTAEEIQQELDDIRDQWNARFRRGKAPNRRSAKQLDPPLTL